MVCLMMNMSYLLLQLDLWILKWLIINYCETWTGQQVT